MQSFGLFVDETYYFLDANPDGLTENNGTLNIKYQTTEDSIYVEK